MQVSRRQSLVVGAHEIGWMNDLQALQQLSEFES